MPRRRRSSRRRGDLSDGPRWGLLLGPSCRGRGCRNAHHPAAWWELPRLPGVTPPACSAFASRTDLEAAWWIHREDLMELNTGTRAWGYYEVELREHPRSVPESAWLAERGLLDEREEGELLAWAAVYRDEGEYERVWGVPYPNPYAAAAKIIRERRGLSEADIPRSRGAV
jgi:hypothetical protein